jgi:hypothetical protein
LYFPQIRAPFSHKTKQENNLKTLYKHISLTSLTMMKHQSSASHHFHGTEIKPDTEARFRSVCSAVRTSIEQSLRNDLDTAIKCLSWLEAGRDKEVERLELVVAELSQENDILVNDIQDAAAEAEELCESLSTYHNRLKSLEDTVKISTSERDLIAEKYHEIELQGNSTEGESENKLSAERSQERFRFSMIVQEQNRTFEAMKKLRQENTELEKENARLVQLLFCPGQQERGQEGGEAKEPTHPLRSVSTHFEYRAIQTKGWLNSAVDYLAGTDHQNSKGEELCSLYNPLNGGSTEGHAGVGADKHHRQRSSFSVDGAVSFPTTPCVVPDHKVNAVRDPIDTRRTKLSQKKKKETKKVPARRPPQLEKHSFDVSFSYFDEGNSYMHHRNAHTSAHSSALQKNDMVLGGKGNQDKRNSNNGVTDQQAPSCSAAPDGRQNSLSSQAA